jgi:hypothetical protein
MSQRPFLPITVHHRHDGWTPDKQWAFVEALARTASVTQAVRAVGMSTKSAYRLRNHPEAVEFRAAWDAALQQAWGLIDATALDRVINGERETIERNGYLVAERHKPCSDRVLIHMLGVRERAQVAARAERVAAHKVALAEAQLAALLAGGGRRRGKATPEAVPLPVLPDDAAAQTAALQAFQAIADRFTDFPAFNEYAAGELEMQERAAAEAVERVALAAERAAGGLSEPEGVAAARAAADAIDFANRPRWEDHVSDAKTRSA